MRLFLVRPDDETNNALVYCLADAARIPPQPTVRASASLAEAPSRKLVETNFGQASSGKRTDARACRMITVR